MVSHIPFLPVDITHLKASCPCAPEICKSTLQHVFSLWPHKWRCTLATAWTSTTSDFAHLLEQVHWGPEDHVKQYGGQGKLTFYHLPQLLEN